MKRAFTLIELIFVIVIIGALAAVAIPKFMHLKENAQAANLVKVTLDAVQTAAEGAINLQDLEGNTSFQLKDILTLKGKYWEYDPDLSDGEYQYNNENGRVARIKLRISERAIIYRIYCDKLPKGYARDKCKEIWTEGSDEKVLYY